MKRDNYPQKKLNIEANEDLEHAFSPLSAAGALQGQAHSKAQSLSTERFHRVSMVAKIRCATSHPFGLLRQTGGEADFLPDKLPSIRLRHGQALWLLTELGYRGSVNRATFYEYIKSLRKLGIPFGNEKFRTTHKWRIADYTYCRIMELAVALSLRVYHVVPDSVLRGIVRYRSQLDRFYRRAYAYRYTGAGRPVVIEAEGPTPIVFRGLFLDLNIKFSGGQLARFGPPKLLSAIEALQRFSRSTESARPLMPMSLSSLSEQIISLALQAPDVHSGPQARRDCTASCQPGRRQYRQHQPKMPIAAKVSVNRS